MPVGFMDENPNNPDQWLKDMPATAEKIGFTPGELIDCKKCSRKNPPNRANCFYCGGELVLPDAAAVTAAFNLRQVELWEKGFNLIYAPGDIPSKEAIQGIARSLGREASEIENILQQNKALPLVRTGSRKEAEVVSAKLKEAGLNSFIVSDEEMSIENAARRLRGIHFGENAITFLPFNNDEAIGANYNDIVLIVRGNLFEKKIASTEKRKKSEKQLTDSSETMQDEAVIDIYSKDDPIGWRVLTKGFDFSCLGADKGLLAAENIKRLAEVLNQKAPNSIIDSEYIKVRPLIGKAWETEQKLASHNWQRQGVGNFNFDSVQTVDNNTQFTKYSRLQWQLLKNK